MRRLNSLIILAAGIAAGAAGSYWYAHRAETVATPASAGQSAPAAGGRKILYYRNPMGLPDTSPVPKKDPMGMDYIAVYADEEGDPNTVKVSLDKIQRSGVRTEKVASLPITRTVRGIGTVEHDESSLRIVTVRSDGYVEDLFVNKTGQHVTEGEPLFRFYSPQIQLAQADLVVAMRAEGAFGEIRHEPERRRRHPTLAQSRRSGQPHRGGARRPDQPAHDRLGLARDRRRHREEGHRGPARRGRRRAVPHCRPFERLGCRRSRRGRYRRDQGGNARDRNAPRPSGEPHEGVVSFIYPEMMKPETRTISVRIELPNPDGKIKTGMYADVVFRAGDGDAPATAVPDSAIIDSGTRQVVLVAKGEGRFEPREVKLGRRGEGYTEIISGLELGEEVVTSATFLIDAESNLKAALQAFGQGAQP